MKGISEEKQGKRKWKIMMAGVGFVGLPLATFLAQHHNVTTVMIISTKMGKLNQWISPI